MTRGVALFIVVFATSPVCAGLHYSGEKFAELPSQWRGFLLDQRTLRNIAALPMKGNSASPARERYLEQVAKLEKKDKANADELADLGALYVRLGALNKAIEVLRRGQRQHPDHFRINANLGTAWQLQGDLGQAVANLELAVRLAPENFKEAEQLHLKVARLRLKKGPSSTDLDDLFGVRFVNDKGAFEPGKFAAEQKAKLPAKAVGQTQQLALWLPADGQLLWLLAELANAHGDVANAAAMMDGCVTAFGMSNPELRSHRQQTRLAAEQLAKQMGDDKTAHKQTHVSTLKFLSKRPLMQRLDGTPLPAIIADGVNTLPWDVMGDTVLGRKFPPTFPQYLHDLSGKEVTIVGFMQPLGDGAEVSSFLFVEHPVGCWFCEMPDAAGIIHVELPAGKSMVPQRGPMRVTGRFLVNATDPEGFLFTIRDARAAGID